MEYDDLRSWISAATRCFNADSKAVAELATTRSGAASKSTSAASMASMLVPEIMPRNRRVMRYLALSFELPSEGGTMGAGLMGVPVGGVEPAGAAARGASAAAAVCTPGFAGAVRLAISGAD